MTKSRRTVSKRVPVSYVHMTNSGRTVGHTCARVGGTWAGTSGTRVWRLFLQDLLPQISLSLCTCVNSCPRCAYSKQNHASLKTKPKDKGTPLKTKPKDKGTLQKTKEHWDTQSQ